MDKQIPVSEVEEVLLDEILRNNTGIGGGDAAALFDLPDNVEEAFAAGFNRAVFMMFNRIEGFATTWDGCEFEALYRNIIIGDDIREHLLPKDMQ